MNETFGTVARALLSERGLSLRAAARAVNYDVAYLSRALAGKQPPSAQLARQLDMLLAAGGRLVKLASVATSDDLARLTNSLKTSRIDGGVIDTFRRALAAQRQLEDTIGPRAVLPAMRGQMGTIRKLAREARGKHHQAFLAVAAEWTQYTGWLSAAIRRDERAIDYLSRAEEQADEADDPTIAAIAVSFKGYVARQRGSFRGVVRHAMAALHTPGVHPAQICFDLLQAAQGYAELGERKQALKLLDQASARAERNITPPPSLYWYQPPFFRMNIGMVYLSLGEQGTARDYLTAGLAGLPEDQQRAEWTTEYRDALKSAG